MSFSPGQAVVLRDGALSGQQGVIIGPDGSGWRVRVTVFGRAMEQTLPEAHLQGLRSPLEPFEAQITDDFARALEAWSVRWWQAHTEVSAAAHDTFCASQAAERTRLHALRDARIAELHTRFASTDPTTVGRVMRDELAHFRPHAAALFASPVDPRSDEAAEASVQRMRARGRQRDAWKQAWQRDHYHAPLSEDAAAEALSGLSIDRSRPFGPEVERVGRARHALVLRHGWRGARLLAQQRLARLEGSIEVAPAEIDLDALWAPFAQTSDDALHFVSILRDRTLGLARIRVASELPFFAPEGLLYIVEHVNQGKYDDIQLLVGAPARAVDGPADYAAFAAVHDGFGALPMGYSTWDAVLPSARMAPSEWVTGGRELYSNGSGDGQYLFADGTTRWWDHETREQSAPLSLARFLTRERPLLDWFGYAI